MTTTPKDFEKQLENFIADPAFRDWPEVVTILSESLSQIRTLTRELEEERRVFEEIEQRRHWESLTPAEKEEAIRKA